MVTLDIPLAEPACQQDFGESDLDVALSPGFSPSMTTDRNPSDDDTSPTVPLSSEAARYEFECGRRYHGYHHGSTSTISTHFTDADAIHRILLSE